MFDMPESQARDFLLETLSNLDQYQKDILEKMDDIKRYLADSLVCYGKVDKKLKFLEDENTNLKEPFAALSTDEDSEWT